MPKGQKVSKSELGFPKTKGSNFQEAVKALNLSVDERKVLKEVLKKKEKEVYSIPVRLKLNTEETKQFNCYVSLAMDEKKVSKNEGQAKSQIATYAIKKLLKGDFYLAAKMKAGYVAKVGMKLGKKK